jgi:hypothetical protein
MMSIYVFYNDILFVIASYIFFIYFALCYFVCIIILGIIDFYLQYTDVKIDKMHTFSPR